MAGLSSEAKKNLKIVFILIGVCFVIFLYSPTSNPIKPIDRKSPNQEVIKKAEEPTKGEPLLEGKESSKKIDRVDAKVVKIIDGDTIDVSFDSKTERIRLIGVDTPETVDPRKDIDCFGKESSDFYKTKS